MATDRAKLGRIDSAEADLNNLLSSAHRNATLYFHYPCFDGLVSAAITWEFLEQWAHWRIEELCPVNYDQSPTWTHRNLGSTSAVVDFLFHPKATLWADHHPTGISAKYSNQTDDNSPKNKWRAYDPTSRSCAELLWRNVGATLHHARRFDEMVFWATKIDSAAYDSVEEALFGDAPAIRISLSLILANGADYGTLLVQALRRGTLSDAASLPDVAERAKEAGRRIRKGLDEAGRHVRIEGDIAVLRAQQYPDVVISRYAPYYFYPNARYSIAMIESESGAKITAMRNPWMDFSSIPLGRIFQKYGGGGHERVGSVVIPQAKSNERRSLFERLLGDVQAHVQAKSMEEGHSLTGSAP
ncbi:MAG: hypothetical protein ACR2IF_07095 [Terriglobales bacterium]